MQTTMRHWQFASLPRLRPGAIVAPNLSGRFSKSLLHSYITDGPGECRVDATQCHWSCFDVAYSAHNCGEARRQIAFGVLNVHEAQDIALSPYIKPFLRRHCGHASLTLQRHLHFTYPCLQIGLLFLKKQGASVQERNMSCYFFNLRKFMRRNEHGHLACLKHQTFHEFIPHQGIEPAKGLVQYEKFGSKWQRASQRHF